MAPAHSNRPVLFLILAAASGAFVSCASGPTYGELKSKLPPVANGQGRVFVYRPSFPGAIYKPSVKIDGKVVGTSEAKGFLYSDQNIGTHEVSLMTEWNHKNTFTVTSGQPTFVECMITPGALVAPHFIPNQVSTSAGEAGIRNCKMIGQ